MRLDSFPVVLAVVLTLALASLYVPFAWFTILLFIVSPTLIGSIVLTLQAARLFSLLLVGRLRGLNSLTLFVYFSVEVLALPVLVVATVFTQNPVYVTFFREFFISWSLTFLVSYLLIVILKLGASMLRGERLSRFLPSTVLVFALTAFAYYIRSASETASSPTDFVSRIALNLSWLAQGRQFPSGISIGAVAVVAYVILMLYSVGERNARGPSGTKALLLVLVGGIISLVSSVGLGVVGWTSIYILTIPTACVVGVLAWVTNEG